MKKKGLRLAPVQLEGFEVVLAARGSSRPFSTGPSWAGHLCFWAVRVATS